MNRGPDHVTSAAAQDGAPANQERAPTPGDVRDETAVARPAGWSDPLTGTDGPRHWDRVISSEQARIDRHRRTATIVVVEIAGVDALSERWGRDAAEHSFVRIARALSGQVRASDFIARVEQTRFAILLTETDEVAAINFVERARSACEAELGVAADSLRIGFGWSSPVGGADLSTAQTAAAQRLVSDLAPRD